MPLKKRDLRIKLKEARNKLSSQQQHSFSDQICQRIHRMTVYRRASRLALYLPTQNEVDVSLLLGDAWSRGTQVFLPVIDNSGLRFRQYLPNSELAPNRYGILEPVNSPFIKQSHLDVVVTPMLGFDARCQRLGMGGGYYDRAFSFLARRSLFFRPRLIGAAYAFQKVMNIPSEPWDVKVWCVATESKIYF